MKSKSGSIVYVFLCMQCFKQPTLMCFSLCVFPAWVCMCVLTVGLISRGGSDEMTTTQAQIVKRVGER